MDKYESVWYPGMSVIWFSCRHKFSLIFFDNFLEFQRKPRFSIKRLRRCGGFKLQFFVFYPAMFVRVPMIPLYEHEVIYFYRRARWLSGKRFVRNRVRKENILSRNCSKYIFLSLCPNNDIERRIFVWRRWYSGEHSCLPRSRHGFDSRPTHHFVLVKSLQANIAHGSSDHSAFSYIQVVLLFFFNFFRFKTVLFFLCEIKVWSFDYSQLDSQIFVSFRVIKDGAY